LAIVTHTPPETLVPEQPVMKSIGVGRLEPTTLYHAVKSNPDTGEGLMQQLERARSIVSGVSTAGSQIWMIPGGCRPPIHLWIIVGVPNRTVPKVVLASRGCRILWSALSMTENALSASDP
jgi:hypothetical protein